MRYEPVSQFYTVIEQWMVFIYTPLFFTVLLLTSHAVAHVFNASRERRDVLHLEPTESFRLDPAVEWNGRIIR